MDFSEPTKELWINKRISNAILYLLLFVRLADQYLPLWIFGESIPDWFNYWYTGIAFFLTVILVWLNKHRLTRVNIDTNFMVILIVGGILYILYFPVNVGVLIGTSIWLAYRILRHNRTISFQNNSYPTIIKALIFVSMAVAFLPIFIYAPLPEQNISTQSILESLFESQLALIAFEEFIFRGILWVHLLDFGMKERNVFLITSFLFWIAHHNYLLLDNTYFFWLPMPVISLLFGYMVWRSKSLTPSTIGHFLFNFTSNLIRIIF